MQGVKGDSLGPFNINPVKNVAFAAEAFESRSPVHCPNCEQALGVKNASGFLLRQDRIQKRFEKLEVVVCGLKQQELADLGQMLQDIFPCDVKSRLLLKAELRQFTVLPGRPELVVVVHRNEGRALLTDRNGFYHEVLGAAWKQTRGNVLVVLTRAEATESELYDKAMLRNLSTQGDQPTIGVLASLGRVLTWGTAPLAPQLQQLAALMRKAYLHESVNAPGIPSAWTKSQKQSTWCSLL